VPTNAGAAPATQATSVCSSPPLSRLRCGASASAARIGAELVGGNAAGAPDGATHAIVERNEATDHPAAGDAGPWQEAQCAWRIGATSTSKTGGGVVVDRSTEQPSESGAQASARSTRELRAPNRAALFALISPSPRAARGSRGGGPRARSTSRRGSRRCTSGCGRRTRRRVRRGCSCRERPPGPA
jgi:hypothetical protein